MEDEWQIRAACRQLPMEQRSIFHDDEQYVEAVAVCDSCPVWRTCVLTNFRETLGIWGCGAETRRRIRKLGPDASDNDRLRIAYQANQEVLRIRTAVPA